MRLLAIDPGPKESAFVVIEDGIPVGHDKLENERILNKIRVRPVGQPLIMEMIASFGMPVGAEVFETVFWAGRFVEAWQPNDYELVFRKDVKMHLCHSMRAKDGNIRQAIIDRFGGKDAAIGNKKNPGPLYGISGDCWSALAVGLTWFDTQKIGAVNNA